MKCRQLQQNWHYHYMFKPLVLKFLFQRKTQNCKTVINDWMYDLIPSSTFVCLFIKNLSHLFSPWPALNWFANCLTHNLSHAINQRHYPTNGFKPHERYRCLSNEYMYRTIYIIYIFVNRFLQNILTTWSCSSAKMHMKRKTKIFGTLFSMLKIWPTLDGLQLIRYLTMLPTKLTVAIFQYGYYGRATSCEKGENSFLHRIEVPKVLISRDHWVWIRARVNLS